MKDVPAPGAVVGDHIVRGVIARGSSGVVLDVEHVQLGRRAALKLGEVDAPTALGRFQVEARALARLDDPRVVRIYDFGVTADRRPYLVLERIAGVTLRDHLRERGPLSAEEATALLVELCACLGVIHGAGIVHRDLTAANIVVVAERPYALVLCDLGVAQMLAGTNGLTATGELVGTVHATAPEQIRGEAVDLRADIYAAGVLLHEMIRGEPPFTGDDDAVLAAHLANEPPALGEERLDAVARRCLAKLPADRYASAAELRDALTTATLPMATTLPDDGVTPVAHRELAAGHVIGDGRYRIDASAGQGGHARVYRATQIELERTVAIKVLHRSLLSSLRAVELFRQEARALARLVHPSIASVHDIGSLADGRLFIAMEWLDGQSLDVQLQQRGPLAVAEALPIMTALCDAVAAAHRAGFVHRDIKPSNVMLLSPAAAERERTPIKLVDFGVARWLGELDEDAAARVGTAVAMAPEQVRGEDVDARTDIYALGVTLYWLITGAPPFVADSREQIFRLQLEAEPRPPSELVALDPAIERVILRCLAKAPGARYPSVEALAADLAPRPARSRRGWVVAAAVAGVAAVGGIVALRRSDDAAATGEAEPQRLVRMGAEALLRHEWVTGRELLQRAGAAGARDAALPVLLGMAGESGAEAVARIDDERAGAVLALAMSTDGARLAVSRATNVVELRAATGELIARRELASPAESIAIAPSGDAVAIGGAHGLSLWTGATSRELTAEAVRGLAWTDAGLVVAGANELRMLDPATQTWKTLVGAKTSLSARTAVYQRPLAQDGVTFAGAQLGAAEISVFDLRAGTAKTARTMTDPDGILGVSAERYVAVRQASDVVVVDVDGPTSSPLPGAAALGSLRVSPRGDRVYGIDASRAIDAWDVAHASRSYHIADAPVRRLELSPDGGTLAAAGEQGVVVYDAADGRALYSCAHGARAEHLMFSSDGARLVTADERGRIAVWTTRPRGARVLARAEAPLSLAELGARFAVTRDAAGEVDLWDARSGRVHARIAGHPLVALDPARRRLVTPRASWDLARGTELVALAAPPAQPMFPAIDATGRRAATAGRGGELVVWEADSGAVVAELRSSPAMATSVAFSPSASQLAVARADATLELWEPPRRIARVSRTASLTDVAFAPDGRHVLGIGGGEAVLHDLDGAVVARFGTDTREAVAASFAPGGQVVMWARRLQESRALLLDGATLAPRVTYAQHVSAPPVVSSDGAWTLAGMDDGTVWMFRLADGLPLLRWRFGTARVDRVDLSPDRAQLAVTIGGVVVVWDLPGALPSP